MTQKNAVEPIKVMLWQKKEQKNRKNFTYTYFIVFQIPMALFFISSDIVYTFNVCTKKKDDTTM